MVIGEVPAWFVQMVISFGGRQYQIILQKMADGGTLRILPDRRLIERKSKLIIIKSKNMNNPITLRQTNEAGQVETKIIHQIRQEEVSKYKKIGEAFGVDFGHCLQMAQSHHENFFEEVSVYLMPEEDGEFEGLGDVLAGYVKVAFYA